MHALQKRGLGTLYFFLLPKMCANSISITNVEFQLMNCLVVVLIMIWQMTLANVADFGLAFYTLPTVGDPFLMNLWFLRSIARRQKNNMRFHVDTYSTPEFSQLGLGGKLFRLITFLLHCYKLPPCVAFKKRGRPKDTTCHSMQKRDVDSVFKVNRCLKSSTNPKNRITLIFEKTLGYPIFS